MPRNPYHCRPPKTKLTRRQFLSATAIGAALAANTIAAQGASGTLLIQVGGGLPGGQGLATLTLLNTSSMTQAAGVPTPTFGWVFKQGDIPAGTAPVFVINGIAQPYSAGLQTYWPDGSLKFATFMLLPNAPVAGNASQAVTVLNGGTWPAASARTLAEVYNQNIVLNGPIASSNQSRGASVGSWVNGDGNQWEAVKWLSGAAGEGWRISTNMSQAKGGAIDGMLICDHYVVALSNAAGGLGGFRWLGAIRQPYYNQSGKTNNAPGGYVWFTPPSVSNPASGLNFAIQPGGTGAVTYTPMPWLGTDGNVFSSVNFATKGDGSNGCTLSSGTHNWSINGDGSWPGNGGSFNGVVFSSLSGNGGNNNPGYGTSFTNGGGAFIYTNSNSAFQVIASQGAQQGINFSAVATGVATPCPCQGPFLRLPFANPDGTYFFFQGTGSIITGDSALHPQIDRAYWISTGVFPPYNLSMKSVANGGSIVEYDSTYTWSPYYAPYMTIAQQTTGDHPDLGILPFTASNDFVCQTPGTLRTSRIIALTQSASGSDFLDASTRLRLSLGNPSTSYGLAAPADYTMHWDGSFDVGGRGFSSPFTSSMLYQYGTGHTSHEPAYEPWAYLRCGDLHLLDLMVDHFYQVTIATSDNGSGGTQRYIGTGQSGWNAGTTPTQYNGFYGAPELRTQAWGMRDMQWVAHLYPRDPTSNSANPVFTDGTNLQQFIWDSAEACMTWPLLQFQQIATSSYCESMGMWAYYTAYVVVGSYTGPGWSQDGNTGGAPQYQQGYWGSVLCLAVARGSPNAKTFLQTCLLPVFQDMLSKLGGYPLYGDNQVTYFIGNDGTGNYTIPGQWITAANQVCIDVGSLCAYPGYGAGASQITWVTTSPAFTLNVSDPTTVGPSGVWRPQAGDVIMPYFYSPGSAFGNNAVVPAGLNQFQPYVIGSNITRVGNNYTFDLFAIQSGTLNTPTGSAVLPTSSTPAGTAMGTRLRLVYKTPTNQQTNVNDYCGIHRLWLCWAAYLGVVQSGNPAGANYQKSTDTTTLLGDTQNRVTASLGSTGAIPPGVVWDTRWAVQPPPGF